MPLSGTNRSQAVYQAFEQAGCYNGMNPSERAQISTQLEQFLSPDTSYLTSNATILPGSFASEPGQAVQVTPLSGQGTTVAPGPVSGAGMLT